MSTETVRILIIEDNPADVFLVKEALSDSIFSNYKFDHVERLSDALETLRHSSFHLVLLDLGLPDSYGLDTFVSLQALRPGIPTVVLTNLADESLALKALQLGAQDYLVKSELDTKSLTRAIRYAIERQRTEENLRTRLMQQESLIRFTETVMASTEFSQLLQSALRVVARNLQIDYCELLESKTGSGSFSLRESTANSTHRDMTFALDGKSPEVTSFLGQKTIAVENMDEDSRYTASPVARSPKLHSGIWVPVPQRGGTASSWVLGCGNCSQRSFSENETQYLRSPASVLGKAIEKFEAEAKAKVLRQTCASLLTRVLEENPAGEDLLAEIRDFLKTL